MSLDIKKSCSFQILMSLTTVVQPGYCHFKWSWSPRLMLMLSCCVWSNAPPSIDLPITKSVVLQHPGCQLYYSYHSCRYKHVG